MRKATCTHCGSKMKEVDRFLMLPSTKTTTDIFAHIVGCQNEHCNDYAVLYVWYDDEGPAVLHDCEPPHVPSVSLEQMVAVAKELGVEVVLNAEPCTPPFVLAPAEGEKPLSTGDLFNICMRG